MSLLGILLIVWGVITGVLILLIIYRSLVEMREDDQLFLSRAEVQREQEQKEVVASLNRTDPYVKLLGATSGLLLVVMAGIWVYKGLTAGSVVVR